MLLRQGVDQSLEVRSEDITVIGLDEAQADRLFRQMLIYANGLAVFLNSGVGQLSETEISRAIGEVCLSLVARYRILDGSLDPEAMRGMLAMPERMPERGATT